MNAAWRPLRGANLGDDEAPYIEVLSSDRTQKLSFEICVPCD